MADSIGVKIAIEGEKEYRDALKNIASAQNVLNAEIGYVSEKFKNQDGDMDALTAKYDVFSQSVENQEKKVQTLRDALTNATNAYGESDAKTQKWQEQLYKAETQLLKTKSETENLQNQIENLSASEDNASGGMEDLAAEIEDLGNSTNKAQGWFDKLRDKFGISKTESQGLGEAVDGLAGKFGVNLPDGIKKTLDHLGNLSPKTVMAVGAVGALGAGAVAAAKKLTETTKEAAAFADNIITMSTVTGISTEKLQEYTYASELLDVSVETITGSQTKLINNMQAAAEGSAAQSAAFEKLGVSATDANGNLRNSEAVFWDVIDALGKVENETERDALAMDLMGKSARDLNPLIESGSARMDELAKEAHDVGYVMDSETLGSLGGVDDAMQKLKTTTDAAKRQLAAQFAPALTSITEKATGFIGKTADFFERTGLVNIFGSLVDIVVSLLEPVGDLIEWAAPGIEKAFGFIATAADKVSEALSKVVDFFKKITGSKLSVDVDTENLDNIARNAAGTLDFVGGRTWVGENGPEIVELPPHTRIYNAQQSRQIADATVNNYYVTIDAANVREFNDIVNIAQNARVNSRKARVSPVLA